LRTPVCATKERDHFFYGAATPPSRRRGIALPSMSRESRHSSQSVRNLGVSLAFRRPFSRFAFSALRPLLADRRMMIGALFFVSAEDHLTSSRLEHAGDRRFDGLADHLAGVVHHNHRSVVEVRDALIEFLALLENENLHGFTRQIYRLESVR